MVTHSSILACEIPWIGGPGRLQSMWYQIVRHNLATKPPPPWMVWELPRWLCGKESACQCRRHKRCRFDPWVRKIPWVRKEMTTHSSILAWEIPRIEEPGGLQSMGLQRVGHNRATRHTQNLPSSWPALWMHCCSAHGTT